MDKLYKQFIRGGIGLNLNRSINEFLEFKKIESDFYESSAVIYAGKLNVFREFLELEGINEGTCESILWGITHNKILDGLQYYITSRNIKFASTANGFITAIKEYFSYLLVEQNINNNIFTSVKETKILANLVNELIKEMKLKETDQKQPISENTYNKLNEYCNNILFDTTIDKINNFSKVNNEPFSMFVSAIMTKIVMFLGIKPQLVSKFKLANLDLELNKIFINGYWLHLPDNLGVQIQKYINFLNELSIVNNNYLFVNKEGVEFHKEYNTMFKVVHKVIKNCSAESISKYTIIQMIKAGINPSIILSLTNFGMDTYLHCQDLVNTEKKDYETIRYLDSKVRKMNTFDIL